MLDQNFIYLTLTLLLFILAGINKLNNISNTAKSLKSKFINKFNIDLYFNYFEYIIILVALLQIFCSIHILNAYFYKNYNYVKYSIQSLIIFTILATYLYHFPPCNGEYYHFMSNLSLIGSLGLLLSYLDKI